MKITYTALTMAMAIGPQLSSAYPATGDAISCYALPDSESGIIGGYTKSQELSITCQTEGPSTNGSAIWYLTHDGCYVTDAVVDAGSDIANVCETPANVDDDSFTTMADNYPYTGSCGGVDPWNYYKCQCTSFVAFRVNRQLGINFHNQYKGAHWGNANLWDAAARQTGTTINNTPKAGSIAQTNAGTYGHVAWVTGVSGSNVNIEEYNWATREGYGRRTVAKSTFSYIHL